ncbi:MAG: glycerophosphodiester phosphodiesterase [Nocardioidaceae bacterium]|jgi:glycerophosphoryl diester phosphodiesterase|nr:glycerophosphodiester phosphodiesterase [Nocardioidaceae bacterium]
MTLTAHTAPALRDGVGADHWIGYREPLVIAHRGASGYRPEHTLAAYRLAVDMGADYIEPDLVSTRDGILVARHENELGHTTDIAEHRGFAHRRASKVVDGREVTGWFVEDLTLAELKTLRATERRPRLRADNRRYDGRFEIPTLDEILTLAEVEGTRRGVTIGVYPELKHPTYFASIGQGMQQPLVDVLRRHHLDRPNAPVFVQCLEVTQLRALSLLTRVPLVQLVDASGQPYDAVHAGAQQSYADLLTPSGLRELAGYVSAIGVHKDLVLPDGRPCTGPAGLVEAAHRTGLQVHVWTLRDENRFLPQDLRSGDGPRAKGDAFVEYERFFDAGVDGVFTDFPDTAVQTRSWWRSERYGRRARYERVSPDATSSSERLPPRGLDVSRSATQ